MPKSDSEWNVLSRGTALLVPLSPPHPAGGLADEPGIHCSQGPRVIGPSSAERIRVSPRHQTVANVPIEPVKPGAGIVEASEVQLAKKAAESIQDAVAALLPAKKAAAASGQPRQLNSRPMNSPAVCAEPRIEVAGAVPALATPPHSDTRSPGTAGRTSSTIGPRCAAQVVTEYLFPALAERHVTMPHLQRQLRSGLSVGACMPFERLQIQPPPNLQPRCLGPRLYVLHKMT